MAPRRDLWRATPARFARLILGLTLFGVGEGLLVAAQLGNSPWTVLAEGVSLNSSLGVGAATVAISVVVLLLWIPLRQAPGLGTIANAIVIGLALEGAVQILPEDPGLGLRWGLMSAGISLVALGSGLYLTAALGPGPRDGLMTGLARRTGVSLRLVRASIEISVLVAGYLLGGAVGIGTVAFAVAIGPGVQFAVERLTTPEWRALMARRAATAAPDGA
ncbi:MAG: hypothetical protein M3Q53_05425 [Actinomycetota bacterium]|nr:hypothetical protein [Actinomycetota bacterium]